MEQFPEWFDLSTLVPSFKLLLYHRTKISQEKLNRKLYIVVAVDPYLLLFIYVYDFYGCLRDALK